MFLVSVAAGPISGPVKIITNVAVLFLRGHYSTLVLYLMGSVLPAIRFIFRLVSTGGQIKRALNLCRSAIFMIIYYILEFFWDVGNRRQLQAASEGIDRWAKKLLQLVVAVLRPVSSSMSGKAQANVNKLAEAVNTLFGNLAAGMPHF